MTDESAELVARWRDGGESAASVQLQRYAVHLIALVQTQWAEKLARPLDPEDVVQSAFRSSFFGACDGRYLLERSGDLWRLLVAIALAKSNNSMSRNAAGPGVSQEIGSETASAPTAPALALVIGDPSPAEAATVADELEHVFRGLAPLECRMFQMRLEGFALDEIAQQMHRSQRTVRRVMDRIKTYLKQRVHENFDR